MTFLVLVILLLFKFGLISLLDHGLWTRKSQVQNQKFGFKNLERYIKIEKKIAIFWCKAIKNLMDGSQDKIHQR